MAWHQSLAQATHNQVFDIMLEPLIDLLRESRLRALRNSTTELARAHHEAIYQAVARKQPAKAARLMRHHLETSQAETEDWLRAKDSGFAR